MNNADVIEGEVVGTSSLAVRDAAPVVSWSPSFAVAVDDAIARKREKNRFFREVMDENLHYGVIPGTGSKPTLLKPGAEMLLANMALNAEFSDAEAPTIDVTGKDHGGEAYIRYRRVCRIYRQIGMAEHERMLVARAEGSCSSWETKYRYRNASLTCPECGKPAIIRGKKEYGGGFVCFKKKDGCGAKFGDQQFANIEVGKVPNPDIAEIENTILKMADKRALVAATLIATGCSDIFTQDVEDMVPLEDPAPSRRQTPAAQPKPTTADVLADFEARWTAAGGDTLPVTFREAMEGLTLSKIREAVEAMERSPAPQAAQPSQPSPQATERPANGVSTLPPPMTVAQKGMLHALEGQTGYKTDEDRHDLYRSLKLPGSSKRFSTAHAKIAIDFLQSTVNALANPVRYDEDGEQVLV